MRKKKGSDMIQKVCGAIAIILALALPALANEIEAERVDAHAVSVACEGPDAVLTLGADGPVTVSKDGTVLASFELAGSYVITELGPDLFVDAGPLGSFDTAGLVCTTEPIGQTVSLRTSGYCQQGTDYECTTTTEGTTTTTIVEETTTTKVEPTTTTVPEGTTTTTVGLLTAAWDASADCDSISASWTEGIAQINVASLDTVPGTDEVVGDLDRPFLEPGSKDVLVGTATQFELTAIAEEGYVAVPESRIVVVPVCPTTTTDPSTTTSISSSSTSTLPFTGMEPGQLIAIGASALLLGLLLVMAFKNDPEEI